jgi:hypothetical protein
MSLILVMALQTAAVATPAAPAPPPARQRWAMIDTGAQRASGDGGPLDFDLARYRNAGSGSCSSAAGADVLVCGPRRGGAGAYPMEYWARIFGPEPPIRAEMDLGSGLQGRIYTEAVAMDRGAVSKRALIGIRTRF